MLHGHSGARTTMQYTLYLSAEQSLTQIMYMTQLCMVYYHTNLSQGRSLAWYSLHQKT